MIQRREFMQLSVAFAALCAGGAVMETERRGGARTLLVYDERFPAMRELISEHSLRDAVHLPVSGDLIGSWRELANTGQNASVGRIVAVTLHSDSVLLRQLAARVGLKLVRGSRVMATRSGASKPVALMTCIFEVRT
jgi:hypothetical protein